MSSYEDEQRDRIKANGENVELKRAAASFMRASTQPKYSYNFSWLGRPIIQYPQDIVAMQELVWAIQPDLIIETGVAHGGSLVLYASLLELNASCGGPSNGKVVGIEVELRDHNRDALNAHPLSHRIEVLQGSSVSEDVIRLVAEKVERSARVLVCLDSNHTHEHVLDELEAYAPFTTVGSYCVVFDTIVEHLPIGTYPDRPWGPGNSPGSAVTSFLGRHPEFEVDESIDDKLLISVAPGGYLKRTRP